MTLEKWCKNQGMTLQEYRQYKADLKEKAKKVYEYSQTLHAKDTGIYYPTSEIIDNIESTEAGYLIMELWEVGLEFMNESTMYRIV